MKQFFLLVIVCISLQATAQNNAISWNKVVTGTIGNYDATMYLQKTGKACSGYYYYDNKQIPIRLADASSSTDSVHLAAYGYNNEESFDGILEGDIFKGIWKNIKDEKTTMLPFTFMVNATAPDPYFDVVFTEYNTEYPVGGADGNNPGYTYFASALWPVPDTQIPISNFLKKWVNSTFGRKNSVEPIGKFFINQKNNGVAGWRKDLKAEKKENIIEYPSGHSISSERRLLIMYQSEQYLSVADFSYDFAGGAHGNYGTSCAVLDLKKMKQLKLTDVFTVGGKQKLAVLLDAAVRTKFNIAKGAKLNAEEGGELLVSKIEPTDNFYITGKGVGFNYVPYEIAAYAFGETNLFIPYEKLKGLLQPAFIKL